MVGRWQIHAVLVLRRLPELFPKPDPILSKVQEIFNAHEVALSKFSDHEMQHMAETKPKDDDEETEVSLNETAQDKLDRWTKEKSQFTFAEYDHRLAQTQYLFTKQKFSKSDDIERWLMPQIEYNSQLDSTLLDTARRAIKEQLGVETGYKVISKIPSSCYSFNYPKKLVDEIGYRGAKVFFIKALLDKPNASVLKAIDDSKNDNLKWSTIEEASIFVKSKYLKGLQKGLLSEKSVDINLVLKKAAGYAKELNNRDKSERLMQR